MIAIVHSIYSQSVHALALNAGPMDNDAGRYCIRDRPIMHKAFNMSHSILMHSQTVFGTSTLAGLLNIT